MGSFRWRRDSLVVASLLYSTTIPIRAEAMMKHCLLFNVGMASDAFYIGTWDVVLARNWWRTEMKRERGGELMRL